jgi:ariadne-1
VGILSLSCAVEGLCFSFHFFSARRDLEKAVEDLSEMLESPIEAETIPSLRQKVTDKTVRVVLAPPSSLQTICMLQVYVQKRNEIVLEDTANGFLDGRWKWNTVVAGFETYDD